MIGFRRPGSRPRAQQPPTEEQVRYQEGKKQCLHQPMCPIDLTTKDTEVDMEE